MARRFRTAPGEAEFGTPKNVIEDSTNWICMAMICFVTLMCLRSGGLLAVHHFFVLIATVVLVGRISVNICKMICVQC